MFIIHLVGSDEENPFKVFASASDAAKEAENRARGPVERVFVYEWTGELREGIEAAKQGRLEPRMHYAHREPLRVPIPASPIRLTKKTQDKIGEIVEKMPKIARKF